MRMRMRMRRRSGDTVRAIDSGKHPKAPQESAQTRYPTKSRACSV